MKKITNLVIGLLLMALVATGCGTDNSNIEQQEEETMVETHYTENQTEMGNYMNTNYAYIANGWVYTIGWMDSSGDELFLKMRTDGSDDTILHYSDSAQFINVKGEYIYAVLEGSNTPSIYKYRLGGDEEKQLVNDAYYLQIVGDYLYYCKYENDRAVNYCRADLQGENEEVVFDKEIYWPYLVDNQLYYQDDADNETLHVYDLESKEDKKITDNRTYQYVLNDDYIYCIQYEGEKKENEKAQVVKINLETLERKVLYEGANDGSLGVKEDRLYFINANDECRLYSIDKNGENISLVSQDPYCWAPCIYDDKLIYICSDNYEYVEDIFICNLDGSSKVSISKDN